MAKTKASTPRKLGTKQRAAIMRTALHVAIEEDPNCDDLYAAAEAIQQLITEHCPIARPVMKQAKKRPTKK